MKELIESRVSQGVIMVVIIINATILGLLTSPEIVETFGNLLLILDNMCLAFFVTEMIIKLIVYKWLFFKSGWNVFDFIIITISLICSITVLSAFRVMKVFRILRMLRGLRAFRLLSSVRHLRIIIDAFFKLLPGMAWSGLLLMIIYYVFAIMATTLYGHDFPEWFGNIGRSMYTLFQVMTFESWSSGIVRPIMAVYPLAWMFFIPFLITTAFIVVNVVIGIMVNSINEVSAEMEIKEKKCISAEVCTECGKNTLTEDELHELHEQLNRIERMLREHDGRKNY